MTTAGLGDIVSSTRPWGSFEQLATNERCTVTIIMLQPGQQLPPRRRPYDVMWAPLDGAVDVVRDDEHRRLHTGERLWVGHGALHRMSCAGLGSARVLQISFAPPEANVAP